MFSSFLITLKHKDDSKKRYGEEKEGGKRGEGEEGEDDEEELLYLSDSTYESYRSALTHVGNGASNLRGCMGKG